MRRVAQAEAVEGKGFLDDASFGRSRRQLLIIDKETLDEFGLKPGQVRENICVSGVPLAGLRPGTVLDTGSVRLELLGECAPCEFLDELRPGLREAIAHRRGHLARVALGGVLRVGDPVTLIDAAEPPSNEAPAQASELR
jgi:MOSC domain-containing protein YiiM